MSLVLFAKFYALADNSPREDVEFGSEVSLDIFWNYGVELMIGVINRSSEALDVCNVNLVNVVANQSVFSNLSCCSKMLDVGVVVGHTALVDTGCVLCKRSLGFSCSVYPTVSCLLVHHNAFC